MLAYLNGKYAPREEIFISPDDRGFLFADGVYEVIRSYNGKLFEIDAHLERLRRSVMELRLAVSDFTEIRKAAERLIEENNLAAKDALIYIQLTRGVAPRDHGFPVPEIPPTVYISVSEYHPKEKTEEEGISVILTSDIRWGRCDIKSISLLPNVLAYQQAVDSGAQEAIFVRDGAVTEGTRTNFFGVFDGRLFTSPQSNTILPGITRGVTLRLCRENHVPVVEFPIFESQLKKADEFFIVGTGAEITPVIRINDWPVGNGKPGPVTIKLRQALKAHIRDFIESP